MVLQRELSWYDCLHCLPLEVTIGAEPGQGIYNPFSEAMVHKVWGTPLEAEQMQNFTDR